MVEQWNSHSRTVRWNSTRVLVEQWNSNGGTVYWNNGTVIVKQCGVTMEQ